MACPDDPPRVDTALPGHARSAPDYYALLGVAPDAGSDTLRAAYKRLAQSLHPDRRPGDPTATERFQNVVEAFSVLGDPERRAAYDRGSLGALEEPRVEVGAGWQEAVGGVLDGLFGIKDRRKVDGRTRTYSVAVSFQTAMRGGEVALTLPAVEACGDCAGYGFEPGTLPEVCERCGGRGEVLQRQTVRRALVACPACSGRGYRVVHACRTCEGTGERTVTRKQRLPIPGGLADGARLLLRGAGEPGRFGGEDGDLHVTVTVTPHPTLERATSRAKAPDTPPSLDVALTHPVPLWRAVLGGPVTVPTLDGPRTLRLPSGSRDGAVLRLAGFGGRSGGRVGDQLVTLTVEWPRHVPAAVTQALEVALTDPARAFPQSAAADSSPDDSDSP